MTGLSNSKLRGIEFLVRADCFRAYGRFSWPLVLFSIASLRPCGHVFLFRLASAFPSSLILRIFYRVSSIINQIDLPLSASIGPGFLIGHSGDIVINGGAIIGSCVTICNGVTIGLADTGRRPGVPIIGSFVYLAPGSKLIGGIHVGDHCIISANSVLLSNAPDSTTSIGNPAVPRPRLNRTNEYISNIDYPS
jgi:serine O-acetyltransferase